MNLMYSYYTVYYICIIEAVSHMLSKENHQSMKKLRILTLYICTKKTTLISVIHLINYFTIVEL